mmetsp:Transcript_63937/g.144294  ORF Transcript_63937/g.144294 Transcript_63937/m.144294 type:complete len:115 (-) Transcript_63937:335-679(-)
MEKVAVLFEEAAGVAGVEEEDTVVEEAYGAWVLSGASVMSGGSSGNFGGAGATGSGGSWMGLNGAIVIGTILGITNSFGSASSSSGGFTRPRRVALSSSCERPPSPAARGAPPL